MRYELWILIGAALMLPAVHSAAQDRGASVAYTSFAVAFVNQLPAILTALGVLVTAVLGFLTLWQSRAAADGATAANKKADIAITKTEAVLANTETAILKTEVVHELVNSKFSAAQAEIVALKREIASRGDSTVDDRVRADVARDQLQNNKPPAVNPPARGTP